MRTYQTIARTAKGFTLVELIVVISVLAVLATIAFTSVSNISMSARNSKRTTDISTIRSQIAIKMSGGSTLASMVSPSATSTLGNVSGKTLAGYGISTDSGTTKYTAGDVNYAGLGMKQGDFSDPDNVNKYYKIGQMSYAGGVYELASSLESEGGRKALVSGTYLPRNASGSIGTLLTATTIKLKNLQEVGRWSTNDKILVNATAAKITGVDADGVITFTPASNDPVNADYHIYLGSVSTDVEIEGLIKAISGTNAPVVNESLTTLPY